MSARLIRIPEAVTSLRRRWIATYVPSVPGHLLSRRSIQGDVATKEGCTKIADQIKAKESVLHTLINCAGVSKGWRVDAHPENREWA